MQPSPNSKGHSEVVLLDSTSLQGIVVNINQQLIDEDQAGLRRSLVLTSPWIISGDQVELLQKEVAKLQVRINQLNRDAVDDKQAADGLLAELNEKRALGKSIIQGLVSTSDLRRGWRLWCEGSLVLK